MTRSAYYQWGLVKPTKSKSTPNRVIFVDTETTQTAVKGGRSRQTLSMGAACYWQAERSHNAEKEVWLDFKTSTEFWDWALSLVKPKAPVLLVSHNMGFDLAVLNTLAELPGRGWHLSQLFEKGNTFLLLLTEPSQELKTHLAAGGEWSEFKGSRWRRTVRCVDNWNLFPGTLQDLGYSVGSHKLPMPGPDACEDLWQIYCRQDVNVMLQGWKVRRRFILDNDLGQMKSTLASQAFTSYRYRFMTQEIRRHRQADVLRLERDAYKGGRSEAFCVGLVPDPPTHKLDINSLYPYVMASHVYPYEIAGVLDNVTLGHLRKLMETYSVIAEVDLVAGDPVFPVRTKRRNVYITGYQELALTTPELAYALERDWILRVKRVAVYKQADLFSEYVRYFYAMKLAAKDREDHMEYLAAKLNLNALAGKFGQKGREDAIVGTCDPALLRHELGWSDSLQCRYSVTYVGGLVLESYERGESTFSFPAIAAHINAYARLYMWRLMQVAGRGNVYYMDTDSLFVNRAGFDKLAWRVDPGRLGALKLEDTGQVVKIHCPKDYEWDGKSTIKGIPEEATQLDPAVYEVMLWPSFTTHITQQNRRGFTNRIVNVRLKRAVNWGILSQDGWVRPFHSLETGAGYNDEKETGSMPIDVQMVDGGRRFTFSIDLSGVDGSGASNNAEIPRNVGA